MMDQWTDRLSEYLDGSLPAGERRELEGHLAECEACRGIVDELRSVVADAGRLQDRPPVSDLWPGIAQKIGARSTRPSLVLELAEARRARVPRRVLIGRTQLAAASAALVAVSAGTGWFLSGRLTAPAAVPGGAVVPALVSAATGGAQPAYDLAVRDLTGVLEAGRGRLDTTTVRVLEQSLNKIDIAIAQARRAVAADPASAYLYSHLAETMRRKLDLLRRAAALVSAES